MKYIMVVIYGAIAILIWGVLFPTSDLHNIVGRNCIHSHGACNRCEEPWCVVEGHSTMYAIDTLGYDIFPNGDTIPFAVGGRGCFPLCDSCWAVLTPEKRLPFYKEMISDWHADAVEHGFWAPDYDKDLDIQWKQIQVAVMDGK